LLWEWLRNYFTTKRSTRVRQSYILNYCHASLRNATAVSSALSLLEDQEVAYRYKDKSGTTWVCLGKRFDAGWTKVLPGWSQMSDQTAALKAC
jgi:hypothetical protein